jgi:hypothetical protein
MAAKMALWPFVRQLLDPNPTNRPSAAALRGDLFFDGIDWPNILESAPPFVPVPATETDTCYFEARAGADGLGLPPLLPSFGAGHS